MSSQSQAFQEDIFAYKPKKSDHPTPSVREMSDLEFDELPPIVQSGKVGIGEWDRYKRLQHFSQVGAMLGINTDRETTIWVHAQDIASIEDGNKPYQSKMFVRGRTSPIIVIVDTLTLFEAITSLRKSDY